ncbi:MAG TPA: RDD family protein [Vicinamibacterales bacterium]
MTEKLTIDTPEQIALELPLAGVGSRFLALAIDTLIQAVVLVALLLIASGVSPAAARLGVSPGWWVPALLLLAAFALFYGYFLLFEALDHGRTPGKRFVGLRVIGDDGRPMAVQQAVVRNLVRVVDSLPAAYGIGIAAALLSPRSQRLGDMAAGTVVVREARLSAAGATAPPARPRGARLGASRLDADEIRVIETFLQRRDGMDPDVRQRAAAAIAARVRQRLALPPGGSDEALLEQVLAERMES